MELGTGIFLSAVLLSLVLLFNATKDRWTWKRIMLVFTGLVLLPIVIGGGYLWYGSYISSKVAKQVSFAGVTLGMSMDEVLYIKGHPAEVFDRAIAHPEMKDLPVVHTLDKLPAGKTIQDFPTWSFPKDSGNSEILTVDFDKNTTKVIRVYCYALNHGCAYINGLYAGMSERAIIEKLGKPNKETIDEANKRMYYPVLNLTFYLAQEEVYGIGVTEGAASPFEKQP